MSTKIKEKVTWKRFGAFVQRLRKKKGLGLREMAKLATADIGGRGLSPAYLSAIERGIMPPPRRPVLNVMARILNVHDEKLRVVADGFILLDIEETFKPFPEYAPLVRRVQTGDPVPEGIFDAMHSALQNLNHPAIHKARYLAFLPPTPSGKAELLLFYRP